MRYQYCSILIACGFLLASVASHAQTISLQSGSFWNVGSEWWADHLFTSQSNDPTAPFHNQSVQYRGYAQGGSEVTLNGANRVYQEKLTFSAPVSVNSIQLSGAAFNGPNDVFRLLDSNFNQVAIIGTSGGNTYRTFTLDAGGVTGSNFYLEEYDTSNTWRYRNKINVDYTGAATLNVTAIDAPTYAANTSFWGYVPFVAESTDSLAPFNGEAVSFRGYQQGGSQEQLGSAYLSYRYRLDYDSPVEFNSFSLDGAAFNGPDSLIRVLDANGNVIGSTATSGGNEVQGLGLNHYVVSGNAVSKAFYVEEYDTSTNWRFRDNFHFNVTAVPEPGAVALLMGTVVFGANLLLRRRQK